MPPRKKASSTASRGSRARAPAKSASKGDDATRTRPRGRIDAPRASFFSRHANVYAYAPNLVGYARIALAICALRTAFADVRTCLLCYLASFACDELDGRLARRYDQCSEFGRALDMITDRLATSGLLVVLAMEHREWYATCVGLLALDVASHWTHAHVQLMIGADGHKSIGDESFFLLRWYYGNRIFMGACCVSVEVLYLCLHAMRADPAFVGFRALGPLTFSALARLAIPGFVVKQMANCAQLFEACETLVRIDRMAI